MTKKHYIAIAAVIHDAYGRADKGHGATLVLGDVVTGLARVMAQDNPAFNRQRFLTACGIEGD